MAGSFCWYAGNFSKDNILVDLNSPTFQEIEQAQTQLNIEIPSRAEMQEIEATSRLSRENNTYFMTASIITNPDIDHMEVSAITFILGDRFLATVRYPLVILLMMTSSFISYLYFKRKGWMWDRPRFGGIKLSKEVFIGGMLSGFRRWKEWRLEFHVLATNILSYSGPNTASTPLHFLGWSTLWTSG